MWNGCSSPWSVPLPEEGLFTFEVRAIDRAGNIDPMPVSQLISGVGMDAARHADRRGARPAAGHDRPADAGDDARRPTAGRRSSASRPSATSRRRSSPSTSAGSTAATRRMWLECTNPMMFSDLTTGLHTFEVRALAGEAAGPDPTPARYTWRVGPGARSGTTPLTCDEANVTLTPNADGWADQVNPLENYLFQTELDVRSGAIVPDIGPITHQNARAFFRFPLSSRRTRLRPGVGDAAALLELTHRGPDARGGAARGDVEGEHAQLAHPARPAPGRGRRHGGGRRGVPRVRRQGARRGDLDRDAEPRLGHPGHASRATRTAATSPSSRGSSPRIRRRSRCRSSSCASSQAAPPPQPPRDETLVDDVVTCGEVITESTRLARRRHRLPWRGHRDRRAEHHPRPQRLHRPQRTPARAGRGGRPHAGHPQRLPERPDPQRHRHQLRLRRPAGPELGLHAK